MQLIQYCEPRNVMLVHGEAEKIAFLKEKIQQEFSIKCFNPANGNICDLYRVWFLVIPFQVKLILFQPP